jgi:hypothetical protein
MRKLAICLSAAFASFAATSLAGKVDTWRQGSTSDFQKGKVSGTVISDRGQIRLSRTLEAWSDLSVAFVWDLVQDKDGNLYAATGDEGKIFKVSPDGKSTVLYDSDEQHIFTLALAPDGSLLAGTAPHGLVLKITPDGKATTHFKTGKTYVWKLVVDAQGAAYAATGTKAEIFKIAPDGQGASLFAAKHNHILALALAKDGSLFAGCDGDGLIYRISPQGKAFVMYDANQEEIHTLLAADDGAIYVGTSSPAPSPMGRPPGGLLPPPAPSGDSQPQSSGAAAEATRAAVPTQTGASPATRPATSGASGGAAAAARPEPGNNAVLRIGPDGAVRELFQDRVLMLALAEQNRRLIVGTGLAGQLFELDDVVRERSEIARLDHGEVLCLARRSDGAIVIGAGDPGKLYLLKPGYAPKGTFQSQVFDTGITSRWGAINWQADAPEGTRVTLAVRTGNVKTPDDTWTDWSPEQVDPQSAQTPCPAARFVQFRATLESARAELTPTLRSVAVRYMTLNQPPEVTKIEVPDVGEGDGSSRAARLKIKWEARDPNNDEIEYTLFVRKEGWKEWVRLPEKLTKKEYDWDADSVPDGRYRVRVEATDRADNPPDNVLTGSRESDLFSVDHTPPAVEVRSGEAKPGEVAFEIRGADALTRIVGASYSIDSAPWTKLFPIDSLFDSKTESFRFAPPDLRPGAHVIAVRVVDAAGNVGTGDLVFSVEAVK